MQNFKNNEPHESKIYWFLHVKACIALASGAISLSLWEREVEKKIWNLSQIVATLVLTFNLACFSAALRQIEKETSDHRKLKLNF